MWSAPRRGCFGSPTTPVTVLDYGPVDFAENGVGTLTALAWSRDSDQLYDLFVAKSVGDPFVALGVTAVGR
jgi:hypothetical protein